MVVDTGRLPVVLLLHGDRGSAAAIVEQKEESSRKRAGPPDRMAERCEML